MSLVKRFRLIGMSGLVMLLALVFTVGSAQAEEASPLPPLALRDIAMSDPTDPRVREIFAIERIQADLAAQSRAAVALSAPTSDFGPQPLRQWSRIVVQAISESGWDIFSLRMDGTDLRRLTTHPAADVRPKLHSGLGLVVFTSVRDGNAEIYTVPVDGSAPPKRLTFHDAPDDWPDWSSDGRIAFASGRDRQYDIYVMATDGSGQVRREYDPYAHDIMPIWSGNNLYWVHYTVSGEASIWTDIGWRQAVFPGELAQLENPRLGVAGLIFDADFDRDGWNELGQVTRGTYGDVPVMIYDPGGTQDIIPGPSHPIQDPTEGDPSLLINRAVYAIENGETFLTDLRIERVRIGAGLQFHTFEPIAPLAMIGNWVTDDKQGPVLQIVDYPTWPLFVDPFNDTSVTITLSGYDPGGSGINAIGAQILEGDGWTRQSVGNDSVVAPYYTLTNLREYAKGSLDVTVQGVDYLGNVGPQSAPIHFNTYQGHINLQTRDVMGRPVPDAQVTRRNWQLVSDRTDATGKVQGLVISSPREGEWITFAHSGYKTPPSIPGLTEYDFDRYTIMDRKYLLPADDIFNHGDFADSSWTSDWTRVVGSVDRGQGALRLGSPGYYYVIGETYVSKNIDLAGLVHPVLNLSAVGWLRDATFRVQIKNQQGVTDLMVMDSGGITTTAVYTDALTEYTSGTSGRPLYTFDLTPWAAQKVTLIISFHTDVSYSVDAAYVGHISLGSWTTPVIDSALISQSGSITNVLELGKSATITVTGQNFLGVPTLRLGQTALISVTVTGKSQITATIPATLGPGIHTLWITNPDKTLAALPTTAIVGNQLYLPLLSRCTEDPFMCR